MAEPPRDQREWMEAYRRRAALDPLRAVLDEGDVRGVKNAFVDTIERVHVRRALRGRTIRVAVDLGCGVCRLSGVLRERSGRVVAVDASEDLLRVALVRGVAGGVHAVRGDLRFIPLRSGAADLVFTSGVLLHLVDGEDLARVAAEASRVLRPGGTALLLENLSPSSESLFREGIAHRSVADLVRVFERAGFRLRGSPAIRKMPSRLIHWAERGRLPRWTWGMAAHLEQFLATRGREAPYYREHLVELGRE